ncbi:MAG: hypothetical protein K2P57_06375 [Burkholderiales bacterium]|nr:hypothetical protein [Burkholderiales bacterium]
MSMLWYYRHDHQITGPIPLHAIERYLILGRLGLDDEVSEDKTSWQTIRDCPAFAATCRLILEGDEARLVAARRFADERNQARRASLQDQPEEHRRSDRRGDEPPELSELRSHRADLFEPHKEKSWMGYILIACLIGLVTLAIVFYQPVNPIKISLTRH